MPPLPTEAAAADRLQLQLSGFEGPLDLLLALARQQKIDLAAISVLSLAEQFLAAIERVAATRLELAAEWLVMAAWLTWLKSRLLLPAASAEAIEAEHAAEALAGRLMELERMRAAAAWLAALPHRYGEVFPRGTAEPRVAHDCSGIRADLATLVASYLRAMVTAAERTRYRPVPRALWSVEEAIRRLRALLGTSPGWTELARFLPAVTGGLARRGALASTLVAGLELAKTGAARLRQDAPFGPILINAAGGDPGETPDG